MLLCCLFMLFLASKMQIYIPSDLCESLFFRTTFYKYNYKCHLFFSLLMISLSCNSGLPARLKWKRISFLTVKIPTRPMAFGQLYQSN